MEQEINVAGFIYKKPDSVREALAILRGGIEENERRIRDNERSTRTCKDILRWQREDEKKVVEWLEANAPTPATEEDEK